MFAVQSTMDTWQLPNILGNTTDTWQLPNILGNTTDPTLTNGYREELSSRLLAAFGGRADRGGFFDSCYRHCGLWESITVDGTRMADAFTHSGTRSSTPRGLARRRVTTQTRRGVRYGGKGGVFRARSAAHLTRRLHLRRRPP